MLIALNLLYLIPGVVGGTETYARSLITALARQDTDNEYTVYVSREAADLDITPGPNFHRVVCPVVAMKRIARYSWEQIALPLQLFREKPALVHSLGYVSPLAARCPQIVSVHDVNYLGHQGRRTAIGRRAFRFFVEKTVKKADRVITISEFSKGEITRHMHVSPDKVKVIHLAGREASETQSSTNGMPDIVRSIGRPYILAFSSLSAHKNIPRLISAFAKIAASVPHALVLVGHLPEKTGVRAEIEAAGDDRIRFTGYLPDEDVEALMHNASVFAFPSLYEGFGMPIIDAQHAGVPLVCSSAGALPEVAGEGAIIFDPHSVDDMSNALSRALLDVDLRKSLVEKGYENARRFSWDRTAKETLQVYAAVAS
jgi:glycosyltransferase involved in cell wall biosynthesis